MACSRVKYNIDYDLDNDLYRLPKAPELIKIANDVALDIFYDTGDDNNPIWVDIATLEYNYGGQWFFNVSDEKNMIVTDSEITGDCLDDVRKFIKHPEWILESGSWDDSGAWLDDKNWND